jgi:hypothetical protein
LNPGARRAYTPVTRRTALEEATMRMKSFTIATVAAEL